MKKTIDKYRNYKIFSNTLILGASGIDSHIWQTTEKKNENIILSREPLVQAGYLIAKIHYVRYYLMFHFINSNLGLWYYAHSSCRFLEIGVIQAVIPVLPRDSLVIVPNCPRLGVFLF